jgi:hypothetical protein
MDNNFLRSEFGCLGLVHVGSAVVDAGASAGAAMATVGPLALSDSNACATGFN